MPFVRRNYKVVFVTGIIFLIFCLFLHRKYKKMRCDRTNVLLMSWIEEVEKNKACVGQIMVSGVPVFINTSWGREEYRYKSSEDLFDCLSSKELDEFSNYDLDTFLKDMLSEMLELKAKNSKLAYPKKLSEIAEDEGILEPLPFKVKNISKGYDL